MDGGCVWEENERRAVVIIPPSIFTRYASLVKSDGWRPRCFYGAKPPLVYRTKLAALGDAPPLKLIQLLRH
jgi:hypothetical protein